VNLSCHGQISYCPLQYVYVKVTSTHGIMWRLLPHMGLCQDYLNTWGNESLLPKTDKLLSPAICVCQGYSHTWGNESLLPHTDKLLSPSICVCQGYSHTWGNESLLPHTDKLLSPAICVCQSYFHTWDYVKITSTHGIMHLFCHTQIMSCPLWYMHVNLNLSRQTNRQTLYIYIYI
jgi:hypothetical protein